MQPQVKMVDLQGQYLKVKSEIDSAIQDVINSGGFINGRAVGEFAEQLAKYTSAKHVVPCANGTDALQIAYMALDLKPGDEVIMPSFNYVASAETAVLLNLKPVFVDVHPETFNMDERLIEEKISSKTKAIVAVHLFGQMANMDAILRIANQHNLYVIEDNAQALGSEYSFADGRRVKSGTLGHINTSSFFPTKNLGCFGDGGAVLTGDEELARKCTMLTRHGQQVKYMYETIGCNSRLDTVQAAILGVKLKHLDSYAAARQLAASRYDKLLMEIDGITVPARNSFSTHVFHQYVVRIEGKRDELKEYLGKNGIPSMIYYPCPLHLQNAFKFLGYEEGSLPVSEELCKEVLALPMHTELTEREQEVVVSKISEAL